MEGTRLLMCYLRGQFLSCLTWSVDGIAKDQMPGCLDFFLRKKVVGCLLTEVVMAL